ncbi:hypothetical protein DE146DRAFT_39815 [Phaeosphaeria sp. MPI-PUGE-AT-0046c]|nr:hypothetical protein DE146DRAFT_39815 [Phaeosphaeria sp. MPI-PUGE-AT-0046c]
MARNGRYRGQVYLAFRYLFQGGQVLVRNTELLRRLIEVNGHEAEIGRLVQKHSIKNLCGTVKSLLGEQVFASSLLAKARFPYAFAVPATQALFLKSAAPVQEDAPIQSVAKKRQDDRDKPVVQAASTKNDMQSQKSGNLLHSISFPFPVQHQILVEVQSILEVTCFACAEGNFPHVLEQRAWDCPESGELNRWARILPDYADRIFDQSRVSCLGKPILVFMESISKLRHAAVHRERLTADELLHFVNDAEWLAYILTDDAAFNTISKIRRQVECSLNKLERSKD